MTVYILLVDGLQRNGYEVEGVYSSIEKAEEAGSGYYGGIIIQPWEVE